MKILAIETSSEYCSVALYDGSETFDTVCTETRSHTRRILPMLQDLLDTHHVRLNQLDALALTHGPGSFTGLRIACSIAQGIAYGSDLPLVPLSTLHVLAQGALRQVGAEHVLAILDARMQEVYWGEYRRNEAGLMQLVSEDQLCSPEKVTLQVAPVHIVGSGIHLLPENFAVETDHYPGLQARAQDCIPLAIAALEAGLSIEAAALAPMYLRNKVVKGS